MATITRYHVTDSPDDFDGPEFDTALEAKENAQKFHKCVVEVEYEFSDSFLVHDFRKKDGDDEEEEADASEMDYDPDEDRTP